MWRPSGLRVCEGLLGTGVLRPEAFSRGLSLFRVWGVGFGV